jgi:hypothetical protein
MRRVRAGNSWKKHSPNLIPACSRRFDPMDSATRPLLEGILSKVCWSGHVRAWSVVRMA